MHLAEQLNQKIVKIFKTTTKKFEKIITKLTRRILKAAFLAFDKGYMAVSYIARLVMKILTPFMYKPSRAQIAYLFAVCSVISIVHLNTNAATELQEQLNSTTQQLQQKDEAIESLETKKEEVNIQLKQKVDKLEDAQTDIEELREEKQKKDAEINRLEQELQAKLQRQREAQLAQQQRDEAQQQYVQTQAAQVSTVAPVVNDYAPAVNSSYGDGNTYPHGECTWGADALAGVPNNLGNAVQWSYTLPQHGYRAVGPSAGAVAVFAPGVHGAGGLGHVAVVQSVNGDGTITIAESNYAGQRFITHRTISAVGAQYFVR